MSLFQNAALLLEDHKAELDRVFALAWDNPVYVRWLEKSTACLTRVRNENQAVTTQMAIGAALASSLRRGGTIRVQPTASSRRRDGVTRGAKRVPAGRPPSQGVSKRPKKQRHALGASVRNNVPSAKSHGQGH